MSIIFSESDMLCYERNLPVEELENRRILVTGASGLVGSTMVDLLMEMNLQRHLNMVVCALGRKREDIIQRFPECVASSFFHIEEADVTE